MKHMHVTYQLFLDCGFYPGQNYILAAMADRPDRSPARDPVIPIEILATQEEAERSATAPHSAASSAHDFHPAARTSMFDAPLSEHSTHSAPTLAIVPHSSAGSTGYARPPWHAPRPFSQHTAADLFAAVHRLEECMHTLTINQRGVALQLGALHTSFEELQRHTVNLEQRLIRQRELQDELDSNAYSAHTRVADLQSMLRSQSTSLQALQDHVASQSSNLEQRLARIRLTQDELENTAHNAHERISDMQSNLRQQSAAMSDLQDTLGQATTDIRQLRRRIGHALQVMGAHLAED